MGSQPRDVTDLRNAVVDMTCECAAEHLAALDALVASLTAARQERDERLTLDESRTLAFKFSDAEEALAAARQREQQLTQALTVLCEATTARDIVYELPEDERGPASIVELVETEYDAAIEGAYRQLSGAVLAGEAPPTAPPESGSAKNAESAPDGEADAVWLAAMRSTAGREGIVTVWDYDGRYVGCMGVERWQRILAEDAGKVEP